MRISNKGIMCYDQVSLSLGMKDCYNSKNSIGEIHHINKKKEEKSHDEVFPKIQQSYKIKMVNKLEIEGNLINFMF